MDGFPTLPRTCSNTGPRTDEMTRYRYVKEDRGGTIGRMSNQPSGAAIIGTAHSHAIGHLNAIRESKNWNLIAAAEPNTELLAKAKANTRWDGVAWTSVDALLSDDRVEMVCVETDPLECLPHALRSIEAGKHVKIDKPPGIDFQLLKKIFDEAERKHLLVQMGYVYRYNPAFRLAYRAIQEGWLGPIRSAACQMNDRLGPAGGVSTVTPEGSSTRSAATCSTPSYGCSVNRSASARSCAIATPTTTSWRTTSRPRSSSNRRWRFSKATLGTANATSTSSARPARFRSTTQTVRRCDWP